MTMTFHIITIFPNIFDSYFSESILKRAQKNKLIKIIIHDLRRWTTDKHKTVDDRPFGGGPGMIMKLEPIYKSLRAITASLINEERGIKKSQITNSKSQTNYKLQITNSRIILLSAKGKTWNQQLAKQYAKLENIILICGRYEGIDERVKKFVDEEISIGPYVLTGGELPAMTIIDTITRLLPNVLGNKESLQDESFSKQIINQKSKISAEGGSASGGENHYLEYPQYTRPEVFTAGGKKYRVPKVLLSGNHKKIEQWRMKKSINKSSF